MKDTPPDDLLSRYLRDRDEACPRCGYNLRSATTSRCPECGHALQLALVGRRRGVRASTVMAIAFTAGSGLGMMIAGAWLYGYTIQKRTVFLRPGYDWRLWLPVWFFLASVPAAVLAFLLRRHIDRLPAFARRSLAGLTVSIGCFCLYQFARWWYDAGWTQPW